MNFTGIFNDPSGLFGYWKETFAGIEPYFYPLVFGGIIGYIYLATQSIIATIVVILITLGLWGASAVGTISIFKDVPIFSQFLYIVTLVGLTSLVGTFVMKRRF